MNTTQDYTSIANTIINKLQEDGIIVHVETDSTKLEAFTKVASSNILFAVEPYEHKLQVNTIINRMINYWVSTIKNRLSVNDGMVYINPETVEVVIDYGDNCVSTTLEYKIVSLADSRTVRVTTKEWALLYKNGMIDNVPFEDGTGFNTFIKETNIRLVKVL